MSNTLTIVPLTDEVAKESLFVQLKCWYSSLVCIYDMCGLQSQKIENYNIPWELAVGLLDLEFQNHYYLHLKFSLVCIVAVVASSLLVQQRQVVGG